jgi:hypothetical protein
MGEGEGALILMQAKMDQTMKMHWKHSGQVMWGREQDLNVVKLVVTKVPKEATKGRKEGYR